MRARLAIVSLAALAGAEAAAAQPAFSVAPGEASRLAGESVSPQGAGHVAGASALQPPVPTDIIADMDSLSLGTQVTQTGNVHTIDGGTRAGANLFHSFSRFDLGQGDFARWVHSAGDPTSIRNVVNRVTGGDPSRIFGTIDSTALPNADFFFINPAGIVFGEGAQVNVPAAAHFSTAQELRFAEGPAFTVVTPGGSTFSVANPVAFGFVGGQGDIAVQNAAVDFLPGTGTLTLSGANVEVTGSDFDVGSLLVTAVGVGGGEVDLDAPVVPQVGGTLTIADTNIFAAKRPGIVLTGGLVRVSRGLLGTGSATAEGNGDIRLRGSTVLVVDQSEISTTTFGSGNAGAIGIAANRFLLDNSRIAASSAAGSNGIGGLITIRADEIVFSNFARVENRAEGSRDAGLTFIAARRSLRILNSSEIELITTGSGDASLLQIITPEFELGNSSSINASSFGSGAAGFVTLIGGNALIHGSSSIASSTFADGPGGAIELSLTGRLAIAGGSGIGAETFGTGEAGSIRIEAADLALTGASFIDSSTFGAGGAGGIFVTLADDLLVDSGSAVRSDGEAGSTGAAGSISIDAGGEVRVANDSAISSNALGDGGFGLIGIKAEQVVVEAGGEIATDTFGLGRGGFVGIEAKRVRITGRGPDDVSTFISTDAFGAGDGGFLFMEVGDLLLENGGYIASDTFGAGAAGEIEIEAGTLVIRGRGTGIQSESHETATGDAGSVTVRARRTTIDSGYISTSTRGAGAAGDVLVVSNDILLENEGVIASGAIPGSSGNAGGVTIEAGRLTLRSGAQIVSDTGASGDAGTVAITADSIDVENSGISSRARCEQGSCASLGAAGSVSIEAGSVSVRSTGADTEAAISTNTDGDNRAGNVFIRAGEIEVAGRGARIQSATTAGGDAGTVEIRDARSVQIVEGGRISSTSLGSGAAGDIAVRADRVALNSGGTIESNAGPEASRAGTILVEADTLTMADRADISTSTLGQGSAGEIRISVNDLTLDSNARIASNTGGRCNEPCVQTGNAGEVEVLATGTVSLRGGAEISSNSNSGSGNAGQVVIGADRLLLAGGRISTSTSAESSGESGIVAINARELVIDGAGSIETISRNDKPAGVIAILADTMLLNGQMARITSSNEGETGGAAGAILIETGDLKLLEGAQINTTSRTGAAGDILISMPDTAFLRLESSGTPSKIDTSSGPGTGGRILISRPYSIISNGGSILALGQSGGANVEIVTRYFISSADRTNLVAVSGDFLLEAIAYDVSAGTVNRDLSVIDASGVLRGQCAAVRQTGQVSQFVVRPIGPYGTRPSGARPDDRTRLLTQAELQDRCA